MKRILILILLQLVITIHLFGNDQRRFDLLLKKNYVDEFINYKSDTSYRIIKAWRNTYGYEILINHKAVIRQLNIPGLIGTKGFKTKRDAKKIAQLVLKKIRFGMMFPSIEKMELDKLNIDY